MRKDDSEANTDLVQRIEQARDLLDEALALVKKTKRNPAHHNANVTTAARAKVTLRATDLSIPMRAFVKRYSEGMNGAKKFTLLVAYLTKGDPTKGVSLSEILKHWSKMTAKGLLGMKFNPLYTSQAKENDWTHTEKAGMYHLRPAWKDIFA
jgi:hypothetical protein